MKQKEKGAKDGRWRNPTITERRTNEEDGEVGVRGGRGPVTETVRLGWGGEVFSSVKCHHVRRALN